MNTIKRQEHRFLYKWFDVKNMNQSANQNEITSDGKLKLIESTGEGTKSTLKIP